MRIPIINYTLLSMKSWSSVDSPDQVGPAIQRALEATRNNQPAVLEMMTKEEETIARYWR